MSSRKNHLLNFPTIVNGDMSSASLTSSVTSIQYLDNVGFQFNFSGSSVGTFQVQVSADYYQDTEGNVVTAGNWIPVTLTYLLAGTVTVSTTVPTSVGSPIYLDLNQLSAPWIRAVYTKASGTGILNAFVTAKVI